MPTSSSVIFASSTLPGENISGLASAVSFARSDFLIVTISFYGRSGNVTLNNTDDIIVRSSKFSGMTTTARDAMTASAGMVIHNSSTNKLQVYNGTSWVDLH